LSDIFIYLWSKFKTLNMENPSLNQKIAARLVELLQIENDKLSILISGESHPGILFWPIANKFIRNEVMYRSSDRSIINSLSNEFALEAPVDCIKNFTFVNDHFSGLEDYQKFDRIIGNHALDKGNQDLIAVIRLYNHLTPSGVMALTVNDEWLPSSGDRFDIPNLSPVHHFVEWLCGFRNVVDLTPDCLQFYRSTGDRVFIERIAGIALLIIEKKPLQS